MRANDETTSEELKVKIEQDHQIKLGCSTVRRARKNQGWTMGGTGYCQLVRDYNKPKRLDFAKQVIEENDDFDNVIFIDESTIIAERYRRFSFRKLREPKKKKLKPKHPVAVHVWAGISKHGATEICIFEGIMDADLYCKVLEHSLLPFVKENLPNHRFMQDNDPKHTSKKAQEFFKETDINWWRTPPESPDLSPIKNLWHELI